MKNKFYIFIIFTILSFFLIKSSYSDEIKFDVTEIEIIDNGNVFKGIKGGKALTGDGVEIIAENFEYNKLTEILTATVNVEVYDPINKISLKSKKIIYFKKDDKFYASDAEALTEDNIKIIADTIQYDKINQILKANNNVEIYDKENEINFFGDEFLYFKKKDLAQSIGQTFVEVENTYDINTSNLFFNRKLGEIYSQDEVDIEDVSGNRYFARDYKYLTQKETLRGTDISILDINNDRYNFDYGLIDLKDDEFLGKNIEIVFDKEKFDNEENDPRLKGTSVYGKPNSTTIANGIFTTCKKRNGKCPPWTMKSKEVVHDKIKKTINYKHAWLSVYDIPITYFPKFFHPDPTVKRQSGFLKPSAMGHKTLGSALSVPYFYVIDDSRDMTFKPRLYDNYDNNKFLLQNEYREVTKKSQTIIDFGAVTGHTNQFNRTTKSHFFLNSDIDLDLSYFDKSTLEVNLEKTTNDTYLTLFEIESPIIKNKSSLNSFVELDLNKDTKALNLSMDVFETLSGTNHDRYQYAFPNYNYTQLLNPIKEGDEEKKGELNFLSSGNYRTFNTNTSEAIIINNLNFDSKKYLSGDGFVNSFNILTKNVNTNGENSSIYKSSTQSELFSSFILASEYPLKRYSQNNIYSDYLTPKISLMVSPTDMKNKSTSDRVMTPDGIFSTNRLGFADTLESGESLTLGVNYEVKKNDGFKILNAGVGSVYRLKENDNIPKPSSLSRKSSDIIGKIHYAPSEFFKFNYDFNLDNNLDKINYNYVNTGITINNFINEFKWLDRTKHGAGYWENTSTYSMNENNSLSLTTRRNRSIDLTEFYDLIYEYKNDCLVAAIQYKKNFYKNNDIKPVEQLFFTLTLVPFTTYSTSDLIRQTENLKNQYDEINN